jgi:hypothetical protein
VSLQVDPVAENEVVAFIAMALASLFPQDPPDFLARTRHGYFDVGQIHEDLVTAGFTSKPKAMFGPVGGGAVRLRMPNSGEWLAIAEGIEAALAVATACAMPAWAALSAGGIRALLQQREATHALICADHDASGTGQRAVRDAARWLAEGRHVRIALQPEPGTDMADAIIADTVEARHVA